MSTQGAFDDVITIEVIVNLGHEVFTAIRTGYISPLNTLSVLNLSSRHALRETSSHLLALELFIQPLLQALENGSCYALILDLIHHRLKGGRIDCMGGM